MDPWGRETRQKRCGDAVAQMGWVRNGCSCRPRPPPPGDIGWAPSPAPKTFYKDSYKIRLILFLISGWAGGHFLYSFYLPYFFLLLLFLTFYSASALGPGPDRRNPRNTQETQGFYKHLGDYCTLLMGLRSGPKLNEK